MTDFDVFLLWEATSRDTIDFKKIYVDIAGDLIAGLLLSQIIYWHLPGNQGDTKLRVEKDGYLWIAKARDDWYEEIRISAKQFDRGAAILIEKGIIVKDHFRFGGLRTVHIRLVHDRFMELWQAKIEQPAIPQRVRPEFPKGKDRSSPKGKTGVPQRVRPLTETTTKTTTKTTTEFNGKINFAAPPCPHSELNGEIVFFQDGDTLRKAIVTRVMGKTVNMTFTETGKKKKYVRPAGVVFYQNGGDSLSPVEVQPPAEKGTPLTDAEKAIQGAIIDLMPAADFVVEEEYKRARRMKEIIETARKAAAKGIKAEEFEEFGIWYKDVMWEDRDSPPAISLETIRKNWARFQQYRGGQNGGSKAKGSYRGSNRTNSRAKKHGGSQLWPMPQERVAPSQLIKRFPVAEAAESGGD